MIRHEIILMNEITGVVAEGEHAINGRMCPKNQKKRGVQEVVAAAEVGILLEMEVELVVLELSLHKS